METLLRKNPVKAQEEADVDEVIDHMKIGMILGIFVVIGIFVFIIVVCIKEKCNTKRSVYSNKNIIKFIDCSEADGKIPNGISSISDKV